MTTRPRPSCIVPNCRCWEGRGLRRCPECGATWHGFAGEACSWCMWREVYRREAVRDAALAPLDVDRWMTPVETRHQLAVAGLRLADAVLEGVVTPNEAARHLAMWTKATTEEEVA